MQMQCPLCDSKQLKKHGKTAYGNLKYRCEVCSNIFARKTDTNFCPPQINFLKFKQKYSFQNTVLNCQKQIHNLKQLTSRKSQPCKTLSESIKLWSVELVATRLIEYIMQAKQINSAVVLVFGIGFALVSIFSNISPFYHKTDVQTFHEWANCFAQCGREIYLACHYDNSPTPGLIVAYPSIGMLVSGGFIYIIKLFAPLTDWEVINNIFRSYLFLFDLFNLFLFITIARMMQFAKPVLIGLMLFLIPSNLAGGAVWGQIDNVALTFCLISSIALIKSWLIPQESYAKSKWKAIAWLILAAVSLSLFILVKQLSIFSVPYFMVAFSITAIKFWQHWQHKGLIWIGVVLAIFAATFYGFDHILSVSDKFFGSSYYYIWAGGDIDSRYIMSANGFNIWIFLGRDPSSSSRIPFDLLWDKDVLSVSPYDLGIASYVIWSLFLLGILLVLAKKFLRESLVKPSETHPKFMAFLFLYYGLSQLGFNLLLTGTHERYLFTGYPFLLLAGSWFFTHRLVFSWQLLGLCFLSAFIYGCFVFSIIGPLPGIFFAFSRHEFLASLHLFLLVLLADAWIKIYRADSKT